MGKLMAQCFEGDWLELPTAKGVTIRVQKTPHPRARRLRLTVTPKGARLSYPQGTHPAQVHAFLRHHTDWLVRKVDELHLTAKPLPSLRVGQPTTLLLRGEQIGLDWAEGAYPQIEAHAGSLRLVIPRSHTRALPIARGLLTAYFESLLRRDISRWLAGYVARLGLAPAALRIRSMKSLWGSLDTRDRISLDLALALAPPAALRYVLVHELCHLKVRSHSPLFWAHVETLLPEWRRQRDWLRQHGTQLKAELDRLIAEPPQEH